MKQKQGRNWLWNLAIIVCVAVFAFSAYQIITHQMMQRSAKEEDRDVAAIIQGTLQHKPDQSDAFNEASFQALKEVNDDLIGYLMFDDGLIELPVVQTSDNSYYLTHSFKGKYSTQGTVFMDMSNQPDDTNLTLYGHYVYADETRMFSPLKQLKTQKGYKEHARATMYFSDHKRQYHVLYVYEYDIEDDIEYDYTQRDFESEVDWNAFISFAQKQSSIVSTETAQYGDHLLTLQTCVRNHDEKRLIVVLKETGRTYYSDQTE